MMNSTPSYDYVFEDICANYQNKSPTAKYLLQDAPPEYYPMLGISLIFFLVNTVLLILETRRHSKYFGGVYFKLSARVMMMLSAFWLFAATSFLGMVFIRGAVFLHFVANTFESTCILAFFDCIVLHLKTIGEVFDGKSSLQTRVPPCCCCLFCLPKMENTKKNLQWLRLSIFQLIFFQSLVEFMRVLLVFDCSFDPELTRVMIMDFLVLVSFLFAMWALLILFKAKREKLSKYRYILKFTGFKVMIILSKFLYKILSFIAGRGLIPSYHGLGAKQRVSIWTNFVTVVLATLLFLFCRKLYSVEDYTLLNDEGVTKYVVEEERCAKEESNDDADDVLLDGEGSVELPQGGRYAKLKSENSDA